MNGDADLMLWVDLETTGSDEARDSVIEVGAILTTLTLDELGEFSTTVKPEPEGLGRLMMHPVVRPMHERNGLLEEILGGGGVRPHEAARAMLDWLRRGGAVPNQTVLAGSGVGHFDRRFLARWMPQVDVFCRHWVIDIGVIRRAHAMWVGTTVSTANDAKTHRALDDIRCHLEEARAFATLWNGKAVAA